MIGEAAKNEKQTNKEARRKREKKERTRILTIIQNF